jgi:uncharacterized protein (DUF2132 family)
MQKERCSLQVKMQLKQSEFNNEVEELAEKFGKEIAERLIKVAGFVNEP